MDYFWMKNEEEHPLDTLVEDGGFCGIFRSIGCVGDSLASGEFEVDNEDGTRSYYDLYEYSWGQFISYTTGSKVYNFSRGGMTAQEYNKSFAAEHDFWNPDKACQAYIIALGVNDVLNAGQEIGAIGDVCMEDWRKNRGTFAGEYGKIIQRLKEIQPDAKFFLVTIPREMEVNKAEKDEREMKANRHAALMHDMAAHFANTYVIDLHQYAPVYDEKFRKMFFHNGHMNACGYKLTAKMLMSYIDYLIRHHMDEFALSGMIGYPVGK